MRIPRRSKVCYTYLGWRKAASQLPARLLRSIIYLFINSLIHPFLKYSRHLSRFLEAQIACICQCCLQSPVYKQCQRLRLECAQYRRQTIFVSTTVVKTTLRGKQNHSTLSVTPKWYFLSNKHLRLNLVRPSYWPFKATISIISRKPTC